ncbi:MAG: hypothetical protein GXZ07_03470 [Firmicutes bacterium]|nr:hypothetical protein [Bacillota bacterium]
MVATFGERLRRLRKEKDLKQTDLAKLLIYHNIRFMKGSFYIFPDYKNRKNRVLEDNFVDYLKNRLNSEAIIKGHNYFIKVKHFFKTVQQHFKAFLTYSRSYLTK